MKSRICTYHALKLAASDQHQRLTSTSPQLLVKIFPRFWLRYDACGPKALEPVTGCVDVHWTTQASNILNSAMCDRVLSTGRRPNCRSPNEDPLSASPS